MTPADNPPAKILAVGIRQIGDLLMCTPAIRLLRENYPEAQIDFVVDPKVGHVLEANPHITRLLALPEGRGGGTFYRKIRRERYDWAIDFMSGPRSALLTRLSGAPVRAGRTEKGRRWAYTHTIAEPPPQPYSASIRMSLVAALGVDATNASLTPVLAIQDADRQWARNLIPDSQAPAPIALCPASKRDYKTWPAQRFAEVCDALIERTGREVLAVVGPGEEEVALGVKARARHAENIRADLPIGTLQQTAALFERCAVYVGNDSGLRHLAIAAGTPSVAIFGRIRPEDWSPPDDPMHINLRKADRCLMYCLGRKCPVPQACLSWVEPGEAVEAALGLLRSGAGD